MSLWLPYQLEWINSPARRKIWVKGRQLGATMAESFWSFTTRLKKKEDHIFCSASYKTSKEFLGYVQQFADIVGVKLERTQEQITFPNGSRIIAVSSNPTALRSWHGSCTLDEFAFAEQAEELMKAALPITSWGGTLSLISTHDGPATVFQKMIVAAKAGENNFWLHQTTIRDAVAQGLAERAPGDHRKIEDVAARHEAFIQDKRMSCLNEDMFNQEYMAVVLSQTSLISEKGYDRCILPGFHVPRNTYEIDLKTCGDLFLGIDVGRSKDNTVIWALERGINAKEPNPKLQRTYRTVLCKYIHGTPFEEQFQMMCGVVNHARVKKVLIERNGIGMALAEALEKQFPSKVVGWQTTNTTKGTLIERIAGWIAQERLALPHDPAIREDILSMKRSLTPGGRITYEGKTGGSHGDGFMALSLALEAAESDQGFLQVMKV